MRPIDFSGAPQKLSALNVAISFVGREDGDGFAEALDRLCATIDLDVDWLRQGRRLTQQAIEWRDDPRSDDKVLIGEEIRAADAWAARRPPNAPPPSDLALAFIAASRDAEIARLERERRQLRRQRALQTWVGALVLVAALITIGGGIYVIDRQRTVSRAQSVMLARASQSLAESGDHLRALRVAVLAARESFLAPSSPEAVAALSESAQAMMLSFELRGHTGPVIGAAYSHDEKRLVSWSEDGTARVWDAQNGAPLGKPLTHGGPVYGAAFSLDDARVLTWGENGQARLWDARTGAPVGQIMRQQGLIRLAGFSPDGQRILTQSGELGALTFRTDVGPSDHASRLWDAKTGAPLGPPLQHGGALAGAMFSHDGKRVLTWSGDIQSCDPSARLWDVATGAEIGKPMMHAKYLSGASFSADESEILTWSADHTIRLWDAARGEQLGAPFVMSSVVAFARFSPDGRTIIARGNANDARIYDIATRQEVGAPILHAASVTGVRPILDNTIVMTTSVDGTIRLSNAQTGEMVGRAMMNPWPLYNSIIADNGGEILVWGGNQARLWDTYRQAELRPAMTQDGPIRGATISADASHVVTWGDDMVVRIWDLNAGMANRGTMRHGANVTQAAYSPNGRLIATASFDHTARIWDARTHEQIGAPIVHEEFPIVGVLNGVAFSSDGARLLTWAMSGAARVWDVELHKEIGAPLLHSPGVNLVGARFLAGNTQVMTWGTDGTLRFWNTASGKQLGSAIAFGGGMIAAPTLTPDERAVYTFDDRGVARLIDVASRKQIGATMDNGGSLFSVEFTKDGARVLTASGDGSARVWDANTGALIGKPLSHDGVKVFGATFSPDGQRVLTWSPDKTARLWNAATGAAACPPMKLYAAVRGGSFSRDGARIVTESEDGYIWVWDAKTCAQIGATMKHEQGTPGAVFSANRSRLLTWGADGVVRVWDTETGTPVSLPMRHTAGVIGAAFSADEKHILSWGYDGYAREWNAEWLALPKSHNEFAARACEERLSGGEAVAKASTRLDATLVAAGMRRLDYHDADAAPVLRGREGEDVCKTNTNLFDQALTAIFGAR